VRFIEKSAGRIRPRWFDECTSQSVPQRASRKLHEDAEGGRGLDIAAGVGRIEYIIKMQGVVFAGSADLDFADQFVAFVGVGPRA